MGVDLKKVRLLDKKLCKGKKFHKDQEHFGFFGESLQEKHAALESEEKSRRLSILEKAKGNKIDWNRINRTDTPIFSFEVDAKTRNEYELVLKRNSANLERKKLSKLMGLEFARVYTIYRRSVKIGEGDRNQYNVHPRERKHCRQAGEMCFLARIAPAIFLEYWSTAIYDFGGVDLNYIPLPMCANENIVKTVVKTGFACKKAEEKNGLKKAHSFSDTGFLAPNLRKKMEVAGFVMNTTNDRHLLSIQRMALNKAKGKRMFIPSELRDMVEWIAEEVYGKRS